MAASMVGNRDRCALQVARDVYLLGGIVDAELLEIRRDGLQSREEVLMRCAPEVWKLLLCFSVLGGATGPPAAGAGSCAVPSAGHATIQAAVDDPGCDPVLLSNQSYAESVVIGRSVTVQGVGSAASVIRGQVRVTAGTVALDALAVDTSAPAQAGRYQEALLTEGGARVSGSDLVVIHRALLFGDGFETGTTGAWSGVAP
jgi:hypothetical protein